MNEQIHIEPKEAMKLLCLHYLICGVRSNGSIGKKETLHSFYSKNLVGKISYNTFVRLYKLTTRYGVIVNDNGSKRLIGRTELIIKLNIPLYTQNKKHTSHRFINKLMGYEKYNGLTFIQLNQKLYELLAIFNFIDQQKKINNNTLLNKFNDAKGCIKNLRADKYILRKSRESGKRFEEYIISTLKETNRYVVTGSKHLSKKLNCGVTKANNVLRSIAKQSIVIRTIEKVKIEGITHDNFELIMPQYKGKYVCYDKKGNFYLVLGSSIIFNEKSNYFTGINKLLTTKKWDIKGSRMGMHK